MAEKTTDYTPGDDPVPVGTWVDYFDRAEPQWIAAHDDPKDRLTRHPPLPADVNPEEAHPDGVAYYLLPVGMPNKLAAQKYARQFVRRTSFRIIKGKDNS
jgi:hypothetical protein